MAKLFAQIRVIAGALALAFVVATAMPVRRSSRVRSTRPPRAVKEQNTAQ